MQHDSNLLFPLTFRECSDTQGVNVVDEALASSTATTLATYPEPSEKVAECDLLQWIAVGCEDGSIFVFRINSESLGPRDKLHPGLAPRIRTTSPTSSVASVKPFGHLSPANMISSRSRAVSDLNMDEVQAPRSFIDHDNDEDRLRALLNNSAPSKGKRISSLPILSQRVDTAVNQKGPIDPSKQQPHSKGMLNVTVNELPNNTPTSPLSLQSDAEDKLSSCSHALRYHINPPQAGPGYSCTFLKFIKDGDLLLSLQEAGHLSVYAVVDGLCLISLDLGGPPRCRAPTGCESVPADSRLWAWKGLNIIPLVNENSLIAYVTASDPFQFAQLDLCNADTLSTTRITCLRINLSELRPFVEDGESAVEWLGEWVTQGPASASGAFRCPTDDSPDRILSYGLSERSVFVVAPINFLPRLSNSTNESNGDERLTDDSSSRLHLHLLSLPLISQPLKVGGKLLRRRQASLYISGKDDVRQSSSRVLFGDHITTPGINLDEKQVLGVRCFPRMDIPGAFLCAIWSADTLLFYRSNKNEPMVLLHKVSPFVGHIRDINPCVFDGPCAVVLGTECIGLFQFNDSHQDGAREAVFEYSFDGLSKLDGRKAEAFCMASPTLLLVICATPEGYPQSRHLSSYKLPFHESGDRRIKKPKGGFVLPEVSRVWQVTKAHLTKRSIFVSSILPLELHQIFLGCSDGYLRVTPLTKLILGPDLAKLTRSRRSLCQPISSLHVTRNHYSSTSLLIAGTEDGTVSLWETKSLNLLKRWTVFHDVLRYVVTLPETHQGRMQGCVLCVSTNGTTMVITVETQQLLYVIPGSVAPLERICVSENNVLLLYGNSRTRLWDTNTQEFWRSMGQDQVVELLNQGGWFDASLEQQRPTFLCPTLGHLENHAHVKDSSRTIIVDVRQLLDLMPVSASQGLVENTAPVHGSVSSHRTGDLVTPGQTVPRALEYEEGAMMVVTFLMMPEESHYVTFMTKTPNPNSVLVGMFGYGGSTTIPAVSNNSQWRLSSIYTTRRLLALVISLRKVGLDPMNLLHRILPQFQTSHTPQLRPDISFPLLGTIWLQSSNEEKQVARLLFDSSAALLSDQVAVDLFDEWRHYLPFLQADSHKQLPISALALFVVGNVALEKYRVCSPSILIDISRSISLYMNDDQSPNRVVAIDLCSRGFHIWRVYINSMELLRSLSRLAVGTSAQKEDADLRNLVQLARTGVLRIAKTNTPLFISTISLDIMDTNSIEHRGSTMQLIAYIIRRDQMILHPNLPRLVEAVVKSLDPNSSAREVVIDSAIEFLGQVVRTYASIDFYMPTQRLAVGTNEGALIMYDLKSASRLYVLDGHKQRLSACTFSPDGRRLVTVSLEERLVMVWKVGSSLVSFFMPGAPPRQGGSGSEPFRKFPMTIEADALTYEQLCSSLVFDWPGPRTARVTIGENVFTFAT